jgi:hypothetical protein
MASFFADLATTYEHFGVLVFQASQSIHSDALPMPKSLAGDSKSFYESVRAFAVLARRLAEFFRTRLMSPLQKSLAANRTTIEACNQRYVSARSQSHESRKRALAARLKYEKAVQDAETAFVDWKRARNTPSAAESASTTIGDNPSEDELPWEKAILHYGMNIPTATSPLVQKLKDVLVARSRYKELVESENLACSYAQKMEITALQEFQKVEQDRVKFFLDSIVSLICNAENEVLKSVQVVPQTLEIRSTEELDSLALDLKKGKELLANLFIKQSASYEEGMGTMDAETLGLAENLGKIRDNVKSKASGCESRIKAAQILACFLESFIVGASKLGSGLNRSTRPQVHQKLR